jgi:Phytanoyl-CoA dioxygenase (PhyH)
LFRLIRNIAQWWRLPFWVFALFTGAKSFVDNPMLGSRRLNRAGLHCWRLRAAHWLAWRRRSRLAHLIPPDLRAQFDQNGFIRVPNFLPEDSFGRLRAILEAELESREHQQGDTITRRVPIGPELLQSWPDLARMLDSPRWKGIMAYVASYRTQPLYYIQTISAGRAEGAPDPQIQLHSDTFHPTLKAWLFLTDVDEDERPLTYVSGSHRLSPERLAWEHRKSLNVRSDGDRLSQRGSFRIGREELKALNLPPPTQFAVPANTLVAADTFGFHARASSHKPTLRVEIWAYSRRTPFLPWTGFDPLSWRGIASRRAQWLGSILDWLARRGLAIQHWRPAGLRRPIEP